MTLSVKRSYLLRQLIVVFLFSTLITPTYSRAQTPRPDSFFGDDFIEGTLEGQNSIQRKKKKQPRRSRKEVFDTLGLGNKEVEQESPKDIFAEPQFFQGEDGSTEVIEENTIPIEKIALVINGKDHDETFRHLKTYSDLLIEYDLSPEAVYTLQIPKMPTQDAPHDWARIVVRGGKIAFKRSLVEKYNLERVPTWIVRTEEGDVLLEGYDDLSPFLSRKGELKKEVFESEDQVKEDKKEEETDED